MTESGSHLVTEAATKREHTELLDLLEARHGLVCFIGAGGKKTILYRVAAASSGRFAITTTTQMEYFRPGVTDKIIVASEADLVQQITKLEPKQTVAYGGPSTKAGRYAGVDADLIERIHRLGNFDTTLIKADGARGRLAKAPNDTEPVMPRFTSTVVISVSIRAIGRPLSDDVVHRVERFSAVTGAQPGELITTTHIADLLSSKDGALKDCGTAKCIAVITCVDSEADRQLGCRAAQETLFRTDSYERIVLAAMTRPQAIVDVFEK